MKLKTLQARNFRNVERVELACGPRLNVFVGENGQGKTNILESIYVLGQLRSFRGVGRAELTRWGAEVVGLKGTLEHPAHGDGFTLETLWDRQRRVLKVQGRETNRTLDYLGHLRALVFSADSAQVVKGPPQERRQLVDRALVSLQPTYLGLLQRYHMALKQRNQLLKEPRRDRVSLDVWNAKFAELGADVIRARGRYLARLNRHLARLSEVKLEDANALRLRYEPALGRTPSTNAVEEGEVDLLAASDLAERLMEGIASVEREEQRFRVSLVGPQRDDVSFRLHGHDMRSYGSQGEQRLGMFLVLMAMLEDVETEIGTPPVVLLDDMTSELDQRRRGLLWEFLHAIRAQVFLTGTDWNPELEMLCADVPETCVWKVRAGTLVRNTEDLT